MLLGFFLFYISTCLIAAFLMAYYLNFAWTALFAALLCIGVLLFYFLLKRTNLEIYRANHLALAMACRALNWKYKN